MAEMQMGFCVFSGELWVACGPLVGLGLRPGRGYGNGMVEWWRAARGWEVATRRGTEEAELHRLRRLGRRRDGLGRGDSGDRIPKTEVRGRTSNAERPTSNVQWGSGLRTENSETKGRTPGLKDRTPRNGASAKFTPPGGAPDAGTEFRTPCRAMRSHVKYASAGRPASRRHSARPSAPGNQWEQQTGLSCAPAREPLSLRWCDLNPSGNSITYTESRT